jgi:lipopolysaccharide/colanic/teichoic acid biosynthesis glycosyltransferase
VVAVNRLKLCLLVVASGLGLLALAVLIVLANAVVLVITLAIVGTVLFLLARRGLSGAEQEFRTKAGR